MVYASLALDDVLDRPRDVLLVRVGVRVRVRVRFSGYDVLDHPRERETG